jgi:hypothetical protein
MEEGEREMRGNERERGIEKKYERKSERRTEIN